MLPHTPGLLGPCLTPLCPFPQIVLLLSNIGGQLGLWMSCSVVCVIEIIEVFFFDAFCIVLRDSWQKVKRWWQNRNEESGQEEEGDPQQGTSEVQGHDNPACNPHDDDLPTFNTAMRLSRPPENQPPRTPPPNYSTLQLRSTYSEHPARPSDETVQIQ